MSHAFTKGCEIEILPSQITGTLTNFPVLIYKTHNDLKTIGNGGFSTDSNGYGIKVLDNVDINGVASFIDHELIYYDGTAGTYIAWARISSAAVGSKYFLGIGDASLNTNTSTTAVWRSEYKGVWHGNTLNDSTSNANTLTTGGTGTLVNQTGVIAGAFSFDGNGWLTAGDQASLDLSGLISISCYMKPDAGSPAAFPINKKGSSAGNNGYELLLVSGTGDIKGRATIGSTDYDASRLLGSLAGSWNLFSAIISADNSFTTRRNGNADFSGTSITPGDMSNTTEFQIGARQGGNRLIGLVEEVRVYAGELSPAWLVADYNTTVPGTFASYTFYTPSGIGGARSQVIICG